MAKNSAKVWNNKKLKLLTIISNKANVIGTANEESEKYVLLILFVDLSNADIFTTTS